MMMSLTSVTWCVWGGGIDLSIIGHMIKSFGIFEHLAWA